MARKELIVCDCCGVSLHAANWWHDADLCVQCGENVPIDMVRIRKQLDLFDPPLPNLPIQRSE